MSVSGSPHERVALASSAIELTVLPQRGARLHRLRVDGHDLLRTPDGVQRYDDEPFFWGAFVMAPWCNRLAAQPMQFGGRAIDLTANFRDGTAIHGQVYDRVWSVDSEGAFSIAAGGNGWPWPYRVGLRLTMPTERTVRIEQWLTNMSDEVMPGGLGLHPWFRRPMQVAVSGGAVHPTNSDRAPAEPVAGQLDLRQLSELPDGIDGAWTDLAEPAARLDWPQFDLRAVMRVDGAQRYVVVASPPEVDALAVEPQSHAAFGLGRLLSGERGGLALIEPGEQMQLITEFEFIRGAGGGRVG